MTSHDDASRVLSFPEIRGRARAAHGVGDVWALVLAAGEGSRLRSLTTDAHGVAVPKQFCSLRDGPSLLHEALQRAETVAANERICAVVAPHHERWWRQPLAALRAANVVVQPQNCGTALGILLPLLHILERDPHARVVVLPSDHYVADEPVLNAAMQRALDVVRNHPCGIALLGMAPEDADTELGYIVPATRGGGELCDVAYFVEKPAALDAQALIARGALWNSFIIAARAPALLKVFARHDPGLVQCMHAAVRCDMRSYTQATATTTLYRSLRHIDFSHDIAEGCESSLTVLRVPACGWTDLGTPERVSKTLQGAAARTLSRGSIFQCSGPLSLERQHAARTSALTHSRVQALRTWT
jgi:mannose-1-phosphate guanylyltransferase